MFLLRCAGGHRYRSVAVELVLTGNTVAKPAVWRAPVTVGGTPRIRARVGESRLLERQEGIQDDQQSDRELENLVSHGVPLVK